MNKSIKRKVYKLIFIGSIDKILAANAEQYVQ